MPGHLVHRIARVHGLNGTLAPFNPKPQIPSPILQLHVWSLTSGITLLSAHVTAADEEVNGEVLQRLEAYVQGLGINHSTIQVC